MNALTLDEVCDRLYAARNPLILMHTRPDGDTVGSAAALMHILTALGNSPRCLAPDPIPRRLSFLCDGLNTEPPCLDGSTDYTVITVDVASLGQLGALGTVMCGRLFPSLMIDHHGRGEAYTDHYVRPDAAAAGEIVYDLMIRMHERGMLRELPAGAIATIYSAISSDTGCFKYSNTTPHTHRIAAKLIETGVDASEINRRLFDVKSAEQLKAEGYVQSRICLHPCGKIAWVAISRKTRESLGLLDEHFETAIDVVRSLEGVEVALAVKESPDGRFKASLRSTGIDVAAIAASLGGGGHVRAAGCSLTAESAEEAALTVAERVYDAIKNGGCS